MARAHTPLSEWYPDAAQHRTTVVRATRRELLEEKREHLEDKAGRAGRFDVRPGAGLSS